MERLSPQELVNLRVEDRGLPMHVAALIILDGAVRAGLADSGRAALAGPRDLARPASLLDLDTLGVVVAVAGGARSVLAARSKLTPRLVLRASVAASVRAAPDPRATGNRVGILLVPQRRLPLAYDGLSCRRTG